MKTTQPVNEIALVPFEMFRQGAKNVLDQSKRESDRQLAKFQSANVRKREARKKKR